MDRAQVDLEEPYQVCLVRDGQILEAQVSLEVLSDLPSQALE